MSLLMTLRIAIKALNRNKMRTILTMLGMIIGVGAVITMVALGTGARTTIEERVKSAGTNMIMISAGNFSQGGVRMGQGSSTRLTLEDAKAVRNVPGVQYVSPGVSTRTQLISGNQNWGTRVEGTDIDLPLIRSWSMKYGSFFSALDVTSAAKVAVLGSLVSEQLYGADVDPTGQILRVRNVPVRIVGVLASKGQSSMGTDQDDTILMPYATVQKKLLGIQHINNITASAYRADQVEAVVEAIAAELRVAHEIIPGDPDDFMVRSLEEMASVRTESLRTMTTLLAAIAGVSLLVGGIGIMNIMLVSVTERTREIGLRMAIGARGRDVLMQFLVEAMVLSLSGGAIGIAVGVTLSYVVADVMQWSAVVTPQAVMLSFGVVAGIGVFFGFYPARKAASLNPIDALRY